MFSLPIVGVFSSAPGCFLLCPICGFRASNWLIQWVQNVRRARACSGGRLADSPINSKAAKLCRRGGGFFPGPTSVEVKNMSGTRTKPLDDAPSTIIGWANRRRCRGNSALGPRGLEWTTGPKSSRATPPPRVSFAGRAAFFDGKGRIESRGCKTSGIGPRPLAIQFSQAERRAKVAFCGAAARALGRPNSRKQNSGGRPGGQGPSTIRGRCASRNMTCRRSFRRACLSAPTMADWDVAFSTMAGNHNREGPMPRIHEPAEWGERCGKIPILRWCGFSLD